MTLRESFPEVGVSPTPEVSREVAGLKAARAQLAEPQSWIKYDFQVGDRVCLLGAIERVVPSTTVQNQVACALATTIREEEGGFFKYVPPRSWPPPYSASPKSFWRELPLVVLALASPKRRAQALVAGFNDDNSTKHADVLRVLDRTIERRSGR